MSGATYPNAPGHRGVDTSIEAARDMRPASKRLQDAIIAKLKSYGALGATTSELAIALSKPIGNVRPRVTELRALGKVEPSAERRKNHRGKTEIVWVMVRP